MIVMVVNPTGRKLNEEEKSISPLVVLLGWFAVEEGLHQGCVLGPPVVM